MRISLFLILIFSFMSSHCFAQCGIPITTFPYNESFEVSMAGWNSGGVNNDWAWGAPSKSFINAAGAGTKCWVTGGLSGSFYNFGERSYVTSPCFNFSSLTSPHVKMKIYWEGENQYDGTVFQYSLNNGISWNNVGSDTDPINCLNSNWFNQGNISALTTLANPKPGWGGTVLPTSGGCFGGLGSGTWVTAQHCMPYLAGQASVQFRFAFGAGTLCNAFDGFAFDDITIGEAPSAIADFTFACNATQLGYQFTNSSTLCPSSFNWNFGDPASGVLNTSSFTNPTHVFSAPGTYNVTLTINGPCSQTSSITKVITTLNATISKTNLTCTNANNGSINATAIGNLGAATYTLQPGNINNNNGLFTGLNAAQYTITISDASGCSINTSVNITSPTPLVWASTTNTSVSCFGLQNGNMQVLINGGTGTINYTLNPGSNVNTTGNYNNLNIGNYTIVASDANGCSLTTILTMTQPNAIQITNIQKTNILCKNGLNGQLIINANGGTGSLNYSLSPGSTNNLGVFNSLTAGMYTITISDANNCSLTSIVILTEPTALIISNIDIIEPSCIPNHDGSIFIHANGGNGSLNYSIGGSYGTSPQFNNLSNNTYTIIVKDANNCTIASSISLLNANAPVFTSVAKTDIICFGQKNGTIQVNTSGEPISGYVLSPSNQMSTNGQFSNLAASIYTVTVTDIHACSNTTVIQINEASKLNFLSIDFTPEKCGLDYIGTIHITGQGGTGQIIYSNSLNSIKNTTGLFTINHIGDIQFKIEDENHCITSMTYQIPEIICCDHIVLPNAFSPNQDLLNDEFRIINAHGIDLNKFVIYNRWGQVVFIAQHIEDRWDGKIKGIEAPIGTYFYMVNYTCLSTMKAYSLKGDFLLIR